MTKQQQITRIKQIMSSRFMTKCSTCGEAHLNLGALDCPYCGHALTDEQELADDIVATPETLTLTALHFEVDIEPEEVGHE